MASFDFDPAALLSQTDDLNRQKRLLSAMGGIGDSLASEQSAGNFALGKMNPRSNAASGLAKSIVETYADPMKQQADQMDLAKRSFETKELGAKQSFADSLADDNSNAAKAFKQTLRSAGIDIGNATAASLYAQGYSPAKMAEIKARSQIDFDNDMRKQNASFSNQRTMKAMELQMENQKHNRNLAEKEELKANSLRTPFGLANTEDDAKQLKGAFESKRNFDSKLDEMIALREKHGGGAFMNRDDVARGKQLSKDLLLEYKNMAKLGVLSAADEAIINAIIPADPLEYNSPLAAVQGQDPILSNLKKFKGDSEKDFATKVGTRTRAGVQSIAKEPMRTEVQKTPQELALEELERRKAAKQTARR